LPADGSEDAAVRRNRLLSAYIFAIDVAHHEYEVSLWTSLGRSGRGAAQGFPRAIDGVAAALAGPRRPSEVREELRRRILDLVVRQIRANRAAAHAILVTKLQLPYSEWNSCAALFDVGSYIDSGSPGVALDALGALIASAAHEGGAER
jgi:hypothetical protein